MTDFVDDYEWPESGPKCPECPHPVAWHDIGGCTLDAICPCTVVPERANR